MDIDEKIVVNKAYFDSLVIKAAKFDSIVESILTKQFDDYLKISNQAWSSELKRIDKYSFPNWSDDEK